MARVHNLKTKTVQKEQDNLSTMRISIQRVEETRSDAIDVTDSYDVPINITQNLTDGSLESERRKHELVAWERNATFKAIIMGVPKPIEWMKFLLIGIGIILMSQTSIVIPALIPMHDILHRPEYWYEIFLHAFFVCTYTVLYFSFLIVYWMNNTQPIRPKFLTFRCLIGNIQFACILFSSHWIWTEVLDFNYPIPQQGLLIIGTLEVTIFTSVWYSFPVEWRQDKEFGQKMKYCIYLVLQTLAFQFQILPMSSIIVANQNSYQPIISLLLPIIREINMWWIHAKLTEKVSNGDLQMTSIMARFNLSVHYTIVLCFLLGTGTTDVTTWVLIGTDFTLNILVCLRIVWTKKRHSERIDKCIDLIQELAVAELVEFLCPLSFSLALALAYYGPNCWLIGNLCWEMWGFSALTDINQTFIAMGTFFAVDLCSTAITAFILKYVCQINLLNAFNELLKEFRIGFFVPLTTLVMLVSISSTIP